MTGPIVGENRCSTIRTVVHIERGKTIGAHSIERVFEAVRSALPDRWRAEVDWIPQGGKRFGAMLRGLAAAKRFRGDVFHVVGDVHYGAITLPKDRTIVTVHDLGAFIGMGWGRRAAFKALYFDIPLRRCAAVTVISEATKERLIQECPWVSDKVRVIPDPLPLGLRFAPREYNEERLRILMVGTGRMKNVERACRALSGIRCEVTIIGRLDEWHYKALGENELRYRNLVNIPDVDMWKAYEECDMVLFPSLYEGFGLPIIEGQAMGRPVVTSRSEPMRSIAGGGAVLVDPFSVEDIRRGVLEVLSSPKRRADLVEAGLVNVRAYTADSVAAEYAKLYDEVHQWASRRECGLSS